jgi:hypothetical protein
LKGFNKLETYQADLVQSAEISGMGIILKVMKKLGKHTSSFGIKYARHCKKKIPLGDIACGLLGYTAISIAIVGPPIFFSELEYRRSDRRCGTEGVVLQWMSYTLI